MGKYKVMGSNKVFHRGYRWVIVDEKYNIISEHITEGTAYENLEILNNEDKTNNMIVQYKRNESKGKFNNIPGIIDVKIVIIADELFYILKDSIGGRIEIPAFEFTIKIEKGE
ncbi:MAG: hypothetical protein FWD38_09175 [Oscillospiraceae bacterium]|nr:hypothetical protein [Oscillospiraceae bacterium]